nr:hypothetical protein [Tanacetum cinerariifolium]
MVIDDKSWTFLGRREREFYIGLEKFINHCKPLVNSVGKIKCPCESCRTILWVSIKHLSDHITRHGFDLSYKTWVHHGEPALPPPPPIIDNTRQPQMSDMTTLLNDLSYIPPNNEHNEPTQRDIGETSNEPTQATRNEFEELYASSNEELYPGCDYVTRLDFMEKFTYFKVKDTPSVRVLGKTAYVGHKRFLKKPHKLRSSREFNGQTDNRDSPKEFGRDEILGQLDRLPTRLTGKHPSFGGVKIKRNVLVELNWTKRSIFYELEYWSFLTLRHNLDIMHIEKNVLEAILNTLLMNDKSKDTVKARQDLQRLGIRNGLWLGQTKNGKCLKPQAAYSFTPENRKKFSKPEGSIAEGYVAEEALTFSSHYFRDVTTKFNRPERNVDLPTCQFQVFQLVCKSIGLRSVIRFDAQELKKVKCLFPNKDMKEEFPDWFGSQICQRHVDNDKDPEAKSYWRVVEHVNHKKFSDEGIIVVEDDPDIIHFDNSSDLPLSTSLNNLDNATLHIDGQSTEVDVPPDIIIDVVDEDDDITDDEDALPHDLTEFDNEELINVDDDDVARSHDGDGGGEDCPPPHHVTSGCMGCFANQEINAGIQQHLQKAYNTNKAAFKAQHWVIDHMTGTYNVEKIRRERPENITDSEWDKYIEFWNDPRNIARAAQNRQNRAKNTVISRQGSRSLARLRDEMRQTSTTHEYPSLIDTFFVAHIVNGEFLRDEDRRIYEEMRRLEAMATYTADEINRLAIRGKQREHIASVGRFESGGASGSGGCGDEEEGADHQDDEDEDGDGDT